MVHPDDEVFAITSAGGVIRTSAAEVKLSGRQTMGVRLMNLASGDSVVAIARNAESLDAVEDASLDEPEDGPADDSADGAAPEAGYGAESEEGTESAEGHGEMTAGSGEATS
jgi:hypothetical protein